MKRILLSFILAFSMMQTLIIPIHAEEEIEESTTQEVMTLNFVNWADESIVKSVENVPLYDEFGNFNFNYLDYYPWGYDGAEIYGNPVVSEEGNYVNVYVYMNDDTKDVTVDYGYNFKIIETKTVNVSFPTREEQAKAFMPKGYSFTNLADLDFNHLRVEMELGATENIVINVRVYDFARNETLFTKAGVECVKTVYPDSETYEYDVDTEGYEIISKGDVYQEGEFLYADVYVKGYDFEGNISYVDENGEEIASKENVSIEMDSLEDVLNENLPEQYELVSYERGSDNTIIVHVKREHEHAWTSWYTIQLETCTEDGVVERECEECHKKETQKGKDALGHDLDVNQAKPTCTMPGYYSAKCKRCDYETYTDIEALGHDVKTLAKVEATCTEDGLTEGLGCTRCDYVEVAQEVIPATGHDIEVDIKAATCTEDGITVKSCKNCDYMVAIPEKALGHDYKDWISFLAPTCTEDGHTEGGVCKRCGFILKSTVIESPGHSLKTVTTEPNCTDKGHVTITCLKCDYVEKDEDIPALGHTPVIDERVEPTCEKSGLTEGKHCSVCGTAIVKQELIEPLGHDLKTESKNATCAEDGYTKTTCSRCDYDKTIVHKKIGHNLIDLPEVQPTCTRAGKTSGYYCTRQGCDNKKEQEEIPALGHDFTEWQEIKAATCSQPGIEKRTCQREGCVFSETRTTEMIDHDLYTDTVDPTCTKKGTVTTKCKNCDYSEHVEDIKALGHDYGEVVVVQEPTCTISGTTNETCKRCGHVLVKSTPALGHEYKEEIVEPTVTEKGYTLHTCIRCDKSYKDNYTDVVFTGWKQIDGYWYYRDEKGKLVDGWLKLNNKWYYFDEYKMVTGYKEIDGSKYYFNDNGSQYVGWKQIGTDWYYFLPADAINGWYKINTTWYYFKDYKMVKGYQVIDGVPYLFNDNGSLFNGWKQLDNIWYYFTNSGAVNGWKQINKKWYYFDEYKMVSGIQEIDGKLYNMTTGAMTTTAAWYKNDDGSWYYFQANGKAVKSAWLKISNKWYYFKDNCKMASNEKLVIDGVTYIFNTNGTYTKG